MVKFGNRGGNGGRAIGGGGRPRGGNRQQGGFKRGGNRQGGDNRRGGGFQEGGRRGGPRRGGRFGGSGPRRGGPRREGGAKKPRDHTALDEDMLQYWDKAGVKDKREEAKVLQKEKLDRELEEYNKTVATGGAADQQAA